MPKNNNQKAPSAAARLGRLPLVRSACAKLSVLYTSAKGSHPSLRSACDVLESSVTVVGRSACCRVLPAIAQLEPQISIANDVACKSLDWLEASFPLLLSPTDQIVATAKNKVHEIQDVVSTAAIGAVYCVQNTVTWVMSRVHQVDGGGSQSLVQRTICVVGVGLDSALSWSEALLDQVLPPSEEDEGDTRLVVGFEATTLRSHYPARLVSLTVKLCRRTYCTVGSKIQPVQVMESLSRSSTPVQVLQTSCLALVCTLQGLPQYLQHQAISAFFFVTQMHRMSSPASRQELSNGRSLLSAAEPSSHLKDVGRAQHQAPSTCRMRPAKTSMFDNGCQVKGCVLR
ncbi:perilipin-2-like isoform X2 [Mugil cephalus]|uniref:perilipin-2-like isoform X2 n=1 Tax=Mugil cephalus TaxID=48193 RepID=UPI001FB648E4|nr:perilipin-2-like isoform X2 [Mugil cephalus]